MRQKINMKKQKEEGSKDKEKNYELGECVPDPTYTLKKMDFYGQTPMMVIKNPSFVFDNGI